MPVGVDRVPKNNIEKVKQMLDKNYEWDKVVELKITETTEQKFLPLLHNVDAEKVDIFTRKM